MDQYSILQVVLVFIVTFIAAIDNFSLLESLYQPIVTGPVIGLILGDLQTGLVVGGTYQLMTIGNMPVGGAQPPNPVMGGIMATVLAISLGLNPAAAVGAAVPFALLGQYGITILFTAMSPMMTRADKYAQEGDTKGIDRINYLAMIILGTIFGLIVTLFFIGGASFGEQALAVIPEWVMNGLDAAGGMMRFVGFAILLKVMISTDLWGFYFLGFALAVMIGATEALGSSALLILAIIGFAFAFWDYQLNTNIKLSTGNDSHGGGEEDGI